MYSALNALGHLDVDTSDGVDDRDEPDHVYHRVVVDVDTEQIPECLFHGVGARVPGLPHRSGRARASAYIKKKKSG